MIPALLASFVLTQVVAPPALVSQYEKAKTQVAKRTHPAHICQKGVVVLRRDGRVAFIPEFQRIRILGGNRLTSHLTPPPSATYDFANRLVSNSSFTYTYDLNGNLTSKTDIITSSVTAYSYDPENRLVRVNNPDGTFESYRYDALGRRIEINKNGAIRRFIYDGEDIILELDSAGFPTDKRIHGPGIDEPILIAKDQNADVAFDTTERFYYHADGLGSIVKMTNPSASVINSYDYDSFGNIVSQIVPRGRNDTGKN